MRGAVNARGSSRWPTLVTADPHDRTTQRAPLSLQSPTHRSVTRARADESKSSCAPRPSSEPHDHTPHTPPTTGPQMGGRPQDPTEQVSRLHNGTIMLEEGRSDHRRSRRRERPGSRERLASQMPRYVRWCLGNDGPPVRAVEGLAAFYVRIHIEAFTPLRLSCLRAFKLLPVGL